MNSRFIDSDPYGEFIESDPYGAWKHMDEQLKSEPMLQFFKYAHLPEILRDVSKPFCQLAEHIVLELPRNPERTAALRKLLEAKDCAVRALIYVEGE